MMNATRATLRLGPQATFVSPRTPSKSGHGPSPMRGVPRVRQQDGQSSTWICSFTLILKGGWDPRESEQPDGDNALLPLRRPVKTGTIRALILCCHPPDAQVPRSFTSGLVDRSTALSYSCGPWHPVGLLLLIYFRLPEGSKGLEPRPRGSWL